MNSPEVWKAPIKAGLVLLRPVLPSDLDHFFEHQRQPAWRQMLGFGSATPDDRAAFDVSWAKHLANPEIRHWAIEFTPAPACESSSDGFASGHKERQGLASEQGLDDRQSCREGSSRDRSEALRQVAGHIVTFYRLPNTPLEVGYGLGEAFWGKGIASSALGLVLQHVVERPMGARCASDNQGSIRVLRKHGFVEAGSETNFGNGRGEEVEETLLILKTDRF